MIWSNILSWMEGVLMFLSFNLDFQPLFPISNHPSTPPPPPPISPQKCFPMLMNLLGLCPRTHRCFEISLHQGPTPMRKQQPTSSYSLRTWTRRKTQKRSTHILLAPQTQTTSSLSLTPSQMSSSKTTSRTAASSKVGITMALMGQVFRSKET